MGNRQRIICLDFESTLVPEFWPAVARDLGIDELLITTQQHPDFPELMKSRIGILNDHNVRMQDLLTIAVNEDPLPDALEFIENLKKSFNKIFIVSDFAEELAEPLLGKFGGLGFFGHRFITFPDGRISHYDFRQENPKRRVVEALHGMNYEVFAAGDSYNDITMLQTANKGILFRAPGKIRDEYPQFKHTDSYSELHSLLTEGL